MMPFAVSTHAGLKRDHNEDSHATDPRLGLFLVADGVGGHANGEVAAAIVRDTIGSELAVGKQLLDTIKLAHRAVLDEIQRRNNGSNMGSTVVALMLRDSAYEIAWVGDSRAYLFDGQIRQLTRDHSPISDLLERGTITAEQAAHHPERHVLNQSLGVSESMAVAPGHITGHLHPGQQILLCSDGLSDELSDPRMADILRNESILENQVDTLVNAALEAGGNDNITVILVGAADAAGAPTPEAKTDLEITQNIGRVLRNNSSKQTSASAKVWLVITALIVISGLLLLLAV